jgi:hypothetical protein
MMVMEIASGRQPPAARNVKPNTASGILNILPVINNVEDVINLLIER